MSSEKVGGAGARGIRYVGSAAGVRGEGYEVRLEEGISWIGDAADDGLDGNSCDNLSEPDVFLRVKGGRWKGGVPRSTTGDPTRSAEGTWSTEGFLAVAGEPIRRGDGTSSMAVPLRA